MIKLCIIAYSCTRNEMALYSYYRTRIGNEGQGIQIRRHSPLPSEVQIWRNWYTDWTAYVSQWRHRLVHSCDSPTLNSEYKKKSSSFSSRRRRRRRKITATPPAEFLTLATRNRPQPAGKWTAARLRGLIWGVILFIRNQCRTSISWSRDRLKHGHESSNDQWRNLMRVTKPKASNICYTYTTCCSITFIAYVTLFMNRLTYVAFHKVG